MCCPCSSTRTSQGGSIAILKPLHDADCLDEGRLLFSNHDSPDSGVKTHVQLQGMKRSRSGKYWVTIHHDGNLNHSNTPTPNALLSFSLGPDSASDMQLRLPQKLDLGVGASGIIGRRVSVMTGPATHPLTVAEGIIGWN